MKQGCKHVFVILERDEATGLPLKVSYELLSKARELADALGEDVVAVCMADSISESAIEMVRRVGADRLIFLRHALLKAYHSQLYTELLADLLQKEQPSIVLFPGTENGRDLAPGISARLKTGLTADCTDLKINDCGELLQIRPTYGGNLTATIRTPDHRPQMATVRPNVFPVVMMEERNAMRIDEIIPAIDESALRIRRLHFERVLNAFPPLEDMELVLIAGYGLGKRNVEKLQLLAKQWDCAIGATRKVIDEGWLPYEVQVGQTGKTIAPEVCVCFGVSGALQHTIGMSNAGRIIAINHDPTAPIFRLSHMSILADVGEVLDELLRQTAEKKRKYEDLND